MLNTPHNTIFATTDEHEEFIAPGSALRLWLIGGLFLLASCAVMARVAWVQTQLPETYLESLAVTFVEEEPIPARDGRILADTLVLAADIDQYAIQLHYRWLQKSADANWLKLLVRQRLSRDERKDPELVADTEHEILHQRDSMLSALCEATETLPDELNARRDRIEQRIQKISDSVNLRLNTPDVADEGETAADDTPGLLMQWASAIRETLTTPPRREEVGRIVVREEESWHVVMENVPLEVAAKISEHPEEFPGVRVIASTQRTYPENNLAVHVVGARTKPNAEDQDRSEHAKDAYLEVSRIGRFGVEKSYDHRLTGVPGLRKIVRDRRQRVVTSEISRKPASGRDVVLTLNMELQRIAEQLLAESLGDAERGLLLPGPQEDGDPQQDEELVPPEPEHIPTGGCVVVMEADSGRIVAAASAPNFDLSMFTEGSESQWQMVNGDTRRPFVSRFTGMALPPGSTFKIVTAIAGLQTGILEPETMFDCQGYLDNQDEHRCLIFRLHGKGHGAVNLRTAMAQSCNVYFFDAARRMGIAPLAQWTDLLQFGKESGIDLPFEKSGTVPSVASHFSTGNSETARKRFEREALGLAIGQSRLTVTPIQMVRLIAYVANGGWLVTPHVVSDEGVARHITEMDNSPFRVTRRRIPGVTGETLDAVRKGLVAVVEQPTGTGFRTVRIPDLTIAGKTGTAEASPGKPDHAWFIGYTPADNPRYAFAVVLEHGGSGSKAAGPIARELVRSLSNLGLIEQTQLTRVP